MFKKISVVLAVSAVLVACAGFSGKGEGESCGGNGHDDCGGNLTCQPITGHGSVCCPTPPGSSSKDACHGQ